MLAVEQTWIPSIGDKSQGCEEGNRDQYRDDGYDFVVERHIDSTAQLMFEGKWRRCTVVGGAPSLIGEDELFRQFLLYARPEIG